ncbi:MAG: hypothetical protein Fur005_19380 [Roseiflexaceae bacterium]
MRTGADDILEEERDLRAMLASLGEPEHPLPPADLVTRTMRRLPHEPPRVVARKQRRMRLFQFSAVALLLLMATVGALATLNGGPALALLGDGSVGPSRALLSLQLLLKPMVVVASGLIIPMILVGGTSALLVLALVRRPIGVVDART